MARKPKWTREGLRVLALGDKPASFAAQFCDENCVGGWEAVRRAVEDTDPGELQVIAICHDRDVRAPEGGPWQRSSVKRHFHVVVRGGDPSVKPRVGATLRKLGIAFRPGEDDWMLGARGVEATGKLSDYVAFLLHGNGYAGDGDGRYQASELVSNLPAEQLEAVCGFSLCGPAGDLDDETVEGLCCAARDLGRLLENFDEWYDELPFDLDQKAKKMKAIRKSYDVGVRDRLSESEDVVRLSVFITGAHNTGKSFAAARALDVPGDRILRVGGGGRGRLDSLRPWTQAIIVDDDVSPGLLNLADNRVTYPYSRGKNNPWTGRYLVVTSNLKFEEWAAECGLKPGQVAAAKSRFYVCEILGEGKGRHLGMESASPRGNGRAELERFEMFQAFREKFDEALRSYDPGAFIDYEAYVDPALRKGGARPGITAGAAWEQMARFSAYFWESSGTRNEPYESKAEYLGRLADEEIIAIADRAGFRSVAESFEATMIRHALGEYIRELDPDDFDIEPCDHTEGLGDPGPGPEWPLGEVSAGE